MTIDRVMLLIDADNVSVDVMEQGLRLLLQQHGAVHVRRAYCTAESAVKHQAFFKRMGIKPMVNLAAGKNSTDIALAVDAVDLVLAERPDVVVIASSDSDFAPLVQRLREKGCVVRGIGQQGKTGEETREVYDDYTVLEHRKAAAPEAVEPAPRKTAARKTVAAKVPAVKKTAAARKTTRSKPVAVTASAAVAELTEAAVKPTRKAAPRKTTARKRAVEASAGAAMTEPPPPAAERDAGSRSAATLQSVLDCLPELAAGQGLALNVAVQRLREAQLLGRNSSSVKLFSQLSDRFELVPPGQPSQVRLRG